jgi:hypothetical protein
MKIEGRYIQLEAGRRLLWPERIKSLRSEMVEVSDELLYPESAMNRHRDVVSSWRVSNFHAAVATWAATARTRSPLLKPRIKNAPAYQEKPAPLVPDRVPKRSPVSTEGVTKLFQKITAYLPEIVDCKGGTDSAEARLGEERARLVADTAPSSTLRRYVVQVAAFSGKLSEATPVHSSRRVPFFRGVSRKSLILRRDGRVAEGARLESVYTARYPGFESLSLRHNFLSPSRSITCRP